MRVEEVADLLKEEANAARALLDGLFAQYDAQLIPDRKALTTRSTEELANLVHDILEGKCKQAKPPKIEDACKLLQTSNRCQHLSVENLVLMVRQAFHTRGLRCECSENSFRFYPSQRGYMALPRLKLTVDLPGGNNDES